MSRSRIPSEDGRWKCIGEPASSFLTNPRAVRYQLFLVAIILGRLLLLDMVLMSLRRYPKHSRSSATSKNAPFTTSLAKRVSKAEVYHHKEPAVPAASPALAASPAAVQHSLSTQGLEVGLVAADKGFHHRTLTRSLSECPHTS